ncbi:MAG: helix-turn-helix domain-containing protein [Saprospiraceae bacterium]|nr:helix-turn-helix domain-containing protein [Saprospiraceae bacterium]
MRLPLILCLVLGACRALSAQSGLPALEAAQIDTLGAESDFPSKCFDAAFAGPRGRFFLRSCAVGYQRQEIYLVQFDGYGFRPVEIQVPESVNWPQQRPRLTHQHSDSLLIGHYANALLRFNLNNQQSTLLPIDSTGRKVILQTAPGIPGETWVLAKDSAQVYVFRYADGRFRQMAALSLEGTAFSEGTLYSASLLCYHNQTLWFTDASGLIVRMDAATGIFTRFVLRSPGETEDGLIRNLTVHRNTVYCTRTYLNKTTLLQLRTGEKQFLPAPFGPSTIGEIFKLFTDRSGNMVIVCEKTSKITGALLIDAGGKMFNYAPVLTNVASSSIMQLDGQDFKKQMKVLTREGLFLLSLRQPGGIQIYFPDKSMRGMIELPSGDLLAAIDKNTAFYPLSDPDVAVLEPYHNKWPVWKGQRFLADGQYVWYLSGRKFNTVYRFDQQSQHLDSFLFDLKINRIAVLPNQKLVLASIPHLYVFDVQSRALNLYLENGHPKVFDFGKQVHDMVLGRNNTLWLGSNGGLWQVDLQGRKSKQLAREAGLQDYRVQVVCESRTGLVWFGTILGGLHCYNPKTGRVRVIDRASGLASNTVVSLLEDDEGYLWAGTYDGLSILDSTGRILRNLGLSDGLSYTEFNRFSYLKTRSGDLYFGALRGLNRIVPEKIINGLKGLTPSQVYLTEISWFDPGNVQFVTRQTGLDQLGTIQLIADKRFLNLSFALADYSQSSENVFAYKLDRPGQQWVHIGKEHQLNLTGLPAGAYDLLIKGLSHNGNWSEPLRIPLQVSAFFYNQRWFYVLLLLIGPAAIFTWFFLRRRRSKVVQAEASLASRIADPKPLGWLENLEAIAQNTLSGKGELTAKYLADKMAISERQLLRKLKAETGMTVKDYIQEIKLQKARHLLESRTFDTIAEVAYACGFNTPAYFSKVYEKRFGKRPGEYN